MACEVRKLSEPARRIAALPALRHRAPASAVTLGRLSKMTPITPRGVATRSISRPLGRSKRARTRPTGSGRSAMLSTAAATASSLCESRARRSMKAGVCPLPLASAKSCSLAARMDPARARMAAAMARSAAFFSPAEARATRRAACRARRPRSAMRAGTEDSTETASAALRESVSALSLKVRVSSMSRSRGQTHHQTSIARLAARGPSRSLLLDQAETDPALGIGAPETRIGTSGWHYASWHGPFYPRDVRVKDFLAYYVEQFDTAEINNSFYRLPTENAVATWRDSTPEGFLFAWKASRFITHMKRLKDIEESIALVFGRMAALGDKFGPVLFQLPPTFKADGETRERVARTLSLVPPQHRYAFEFRHPSWYEDATLDLLRDHDAALCISDHAAAPAPWLATASFVYVRAHGTN